MHDAFLDLAIAQAQEAFRENEVPVGAVIVENNRVIASAYNQIESTQDPTQHAELNVIKRAANYKKSWRLMGCRLYTSLEPCPMCVGAMIHARIDHVVYAALEPKWGCIESKVNLLAISFNHDMQSTYRPIARSSRMLSDFFKLKRVEKKNRCHHLK